jgi:hypothetical protein
MRVRGRRFLNIEKINDPKNWRAFWTMERRQALKTVNFTMAPMLLIMYFFTSGGTSSR